MNLLPYIIGALLALLVWGFFNLKLRTPSEQPKGSLKPRMTTWFAGLQAKHFPKVRLGVRDLIFWPLLLVVILFVIGICGLVWKLLSWSWSLLKEIPSGFEHHWWKALIAIIILTIIFDFYIKGRGTKDTWGKRWDNWREKFYFAILWAVIIGFINIMLRHLDVGAWWSLWNYKTPGSWFFWTLMAVYTISMLLIVNMDAKKVRVCGGILFVLALIFTAIGVSKSKHAQGQIATMPAQKPTMFLRAGTWTAFEVRGNLFIDTHGTPYKVRINDQTEEMASSERLTFPPSPRVEKLWINPERDVTVTLHYSS